MGFTHYFRRAVKVEDEAWKLLCEDTKKLLESADIPLSFPEGEGDTDGFKIDGEEINFNGSGALAHENVYFPKIIIEDQYTQAEKSKVFSFCKTAQKPYDKYVTAFLLLAKFHMQDNINITSDGEVEEWNDGLEIFNRIFEYGATMKEHPEGTFEGDWDESLDLAIINFAYYDSISVDEFEKSL